MENQRQVWRAKAFVKVNIFYDVKKIDAYSEDIGEGGLKIETLEYLPINEEVLLQIPIISPDKVKANILAEEKSSGANIYRLQFINVSKNYKNQLLKYILDKIKR
jgi:c-di-GMP-binding flagellar brake protein YcgR